MRKHLDTGSRNNAHKEQHLYFARGILPRNLRWKIGAQIVFLASSLIESNTKCKRNGTTIDGRNLMHMGGDTRCMWVAKSTTKGIHRGQKILSSQLKQAWEKRGVTFRSVRFPRRKDVKDFLARVARLIAPLHHEAQYGFIPNRDCIKSATKHADASTVFLIDIENAFDQVTESEVYDILNKVFMVNSKMAHWIASISCHEGHLYQGNPLAPAIFNVRALWMTEWLHRLCKARGATLTVYADDITISTELWDYFSSGFQKTVYRIIRECGLKVNPTKSKVRRVSPNRIGHYDITGLTIDFDEVGRPYVRPLKRRRTQRKAAYFAHLQAIGCTHSLELNKDGSLKELDLITKGLEQWVQRRGEPQIKQLAIPTK